MSVVQAGPKALGTAAGTDVGALRGAEKKVWFYVVWWHNTSPACTNAAQGVVSPAGLVRGTCARNSARALEPCAMDVLGPCCPHACLVSCVPPQPPQMTRPALCACACTRLSRRTVQQHDGVPQLAGAIRVEAARVADVLGSVADEKQTFEAAWRGKVPSSGKLIQEL